MGDPSRIAALERELAEERANRERAEYALSRFKDAAAQRPDYETLWAEAVERAEAAESLAATARRDAFEEAAKVAATQWTGEIAASVIRSLATVPGGEGKSETYRTEKESKG